MTMRSVALSIEMPRPGSTSIVDSLRMPRMLRAPLR
jgi:hypothetical protein